MPEVNYLIKLQERRDGRFIGIYYYCINYAGILN